MKDELISLGPRKLGNILIRVSENPGQEGRKTFQLRRLARNILVISEKRWTFLKMQTRKSQNSGSFITDSKTSV